MEELSRDNLMELMRPSMYWVSTMMRDLKSILNEEAGFNAVPRLMRQVFGDNILGILQGRNEVSMVRLMDVCSIVQTDILIDEDEGKGYLLTVLEDVLFHAGEIFQTCEYVMELVARLGFGECTPEFLDELGAEFVGTV